MLKSFSITDIGRKRKLNQDYVYTSEQPVGKLPNLFLVADGMGGHNAGDIASRCAVETIVQTVSQSSEGDPIIVLRKAIEAANERVRTKAGEEECLFGMGTTVVAATYRDGVLTVANVGDSRLYVADGELRQITKDHSLVEEMVQLGGLDRAAARNHPNKNIITRAVGAGDAIEADFFTVKLSEGDLVLMCTDGLTNMLEDEQIYSILKGQKVLCDKVSELVKAANDNGGRDNIAVVLIEL